MNENQIVTSGQEAYQVGGDPLDAVRIGDWYWVQVCKGDDEGDPEGKDFDPEKAKEQLWCVEELGSNYVKFRLEREHGNSFLTLHVNHFYARCRREDNWKEVLQARIDAIQVQMTETMQQMLEEGRSLSLIPQEATETPEPEDDSFLPVLATSSPTKYKTDLVLFRDERMPALQKQIDTLAKEYAVETRHLALSDMAKMRQVGKALKVVDDRIFTVELYCGLQETVHQIADGTPANVNEPICLRQQVLYMDEETLFDYADGGMDFRSLEDFDKWVVKSENLNRILPEQRGIVAFRVRRSWKEYGEASSLSQAWVQLSWHDANKETYLLIRNGEKVYRIATSIDFTPRLIPFRDEIGEAQFKKVYREKVEHITPDDVRFDEHVEDMDKKLRHYNRMIILIQGLLDRSSVFMPHQGIKLTRDDHMGKWLSCIRDEEDALPSNVITWDAYRDKCNATIRKGDKIYSTWWPKDDYHWGHYDHRSNRDRRVYSPREHAVMDRPPVCEVVSISRDKKSVKIKWQPGGWISGRYGKYGVWIDSHEDTRWVRFDVPTEHVFNIAAYQLDDYKMFLCDHSLKGCYNKWAAPLLTSEDLKRIDAGRTPKSPRPGWTRIVSSWRGETSVGWQKDGS